MHFGMTGETPDISETACQYLLLCTGWIHIKGIRTAYTNYYKKMKEGEENQWPPKFWKFHLTTEDPAVELAFTDPRRFGRVRLVDCPGADIRKFSPLVENGPDPVVDKDIFTEGFLRQKMKSRHVPIKALLLDQTTLSGVGNWVADEVLYQAKLHPEQYCDEFNDEQIKNLYKSIRYVCQTAVDKLGDSDEFPDDWLFHFRWGKGSSGGTSHLPNGEKLAFITVGGRTSCYAPGIQKKSGHIAPGVKEEPMVTDDGSNKKKAPNSKAKPTGKRAKPADDEMEEKPKKMKTEKPKKDAVAAKPGKTSVGSQPQESNGTRRRSGRLGGKST
jgi:formamidopyrimidine-DNA glycosylase